MDRLKSPPSSGRPSGDLLDLPLKDDDKTVEAPRTVPLRRPTPPSQAPTPRPPIRRRETPPGATAQTRVAVARRRNPWPFLAVLALLAGGALGFLFKPDPPIAVLSTELVDFGEVRLGERGELQGVEVRNAGGRTLTLGQLRVDDESAELSLESDGCSGREVKAGEACTVELAFAPREAGGRRGWLVIGGEAPNLERRLAVVGTGVAPQLEASPTELDFGERLVGTASPRSSLELVNRGTAPYVLGTVAFEGRGAGDFVVRGDGCSGKTLAPGERCRLQVSFVPTATGKRQATLGLGDGGALAVAPRLEGEGLARKAALDVEPARLTFDPQLAGRASAPRAVTLTNGGTGVLKVLGVDVLTPSGVPEGGAASVFEVDAASCLGSALAPGKSCRAAVRFRPAAEGSFAAVLEVRHDAGSPRRLPMTGDGTVPRVFLDPLVLDFGTVQAGTVSESKVLRLSNSGSGPLLVDEIRLRGAGAQSFSARPVGCTTGPLEPKTSCGVEVQFKPRRRGSFNAELEIRHNAEGSPHQVEVRGEGRE